MSRTISTNSQNIYVGNSAEAATSAEKLSAYSGVKIKVDSDTSYSAGDTEGRVLEIDNPYGNQSMADNIYAQINGYAFQPLTITGALMNPAAELGDSVTSHGKYTGIFKQVINYGDRVQEDISASAEGTTEHEYNYIGKNNKFATYAGLAAGTTTVNGKGLTAGSVSGGSGGAIASSTVTSENVDQYLNDSAKNANTAIAYIDAWIDGTGATFGGIDVSSLNCTGVMYYKGGSVYVGTDNCLHISY